MNSATYKLSAGSVDIIEEDGKIVRLALSKGDGGCYGSDTELLAETSRQLDEYFAGSRKTFDLPLELRGSDFQLRVWRYLQSIPYGQTLTYGEVAEAIGAAGAARAVGAACGQNPVLIVVPCHRVVGSGGKLGGYVGGTILKEQLLALEVSCAAFS